MRILTFSTLYPNHVRPHHGIFVENRLRRLVETGSIDTRVVAPVPWFPSSAAYFRRYANFAKVASAEEKFGIAIEHPRYPVIPKVGMTLAPILLYAWSLPKVLEILRSGFDFDLIDAHYFYPDGVAAAMLAQKLNKPLVISARGSDINLIPRYRLPRRMICWAADNAIALVAVCQALKDQMVNLGIDGSKVQVLRNGVDLGVFRPLDPVAVKRRHDVPETTLVMVGNLVGLKGHDIAIRALAQLPGMKLLVAGEGPLEASLRSLAKTLDLSDRVRFLGTVSHRELPEIYNGADVLLLPSASEGMPNVLLEAMACGTPVIASDVGGASEVIACGRSGLLLPERSPEALAAAVRRLLDCPPERAEVRKHAEQFGWTKTVENQLRLFDRAIAAEIEPAARHDRVGAGGP